MKNADKFVVGGQVYDVLSPATFGDYMETIGSACINPDGYAENKLFLAYDDNVQKLFRATAAIAYSELLIKNTNCEPTTMAEALANALSAGGVSYDNSDSGLTASNVQGAIDEVNENVETVNSDLSNEIDARSILGAHNILPNTATSTTLNGVTFTVRDDGSIATSGTSMAKFNYVVAQKDILKSLLKYVGKEVILTGCPEGGYMPDPEIDPDPNDTYRLNAISLVGTDGDIRSDIGDGVKFTVGDFSNFINDAIVAIRIGNSGVNMNGKVFKPMIRLASDEDDTYQHYVKTNSELTDDVTPKPINSFSTNKGFFADYNNSCQIGKLVCLNFRLGVSSNVTPASDTVAITGLPAPKTGEFTLFSFKTWDATAPTVLKLDASGNLSFPSSNFSPSTSYIINVSYVAK